MARQLVDRIGSFTAVPNQFIDSAAVGSDAFRVFVYLRRCVNSANGQETAWPAYETILDACRLGHRRKLAAALKELGDAGWIERHRRFGTSTVYVLKMPEMAVSNVDSPPPVVPPGGTTVVPPGGTIVVPPGGTLTRLKEQDEKNKRESDAPVSQKRRVAGFSTVHVQHDDPRVSAYLKTVKPEITETNAAIIMDSVSLDGLTVWQTVLTMWAEREYKPTNFVGMLERYATSMNAQRIRAAQPPKAPAASSNGRSVYPQVADPTAAELEAARARAREQRLARQKEKEGGR